MAASESSSAQRASGGEAAGPVLLFDGECGLCQRLVGMLLRWDRAGRLRFAPLQGAAAQAYLRARGWPTEDFDSLVFVSDWAVRGSGEPRLRTDGAIAALRVVGGSGRMAAAVLAVWPASWREAGYRGVARWRYRIFGKGTTQPLARAEWAARFLR